MEGEPVAKGWKEPEQGKLPEFKVLTNWILHQRYIKGVNPAVNVI